MEGEGGLAEVRPEARTAGANPKVNACIATGGTAPCSAAAPLAARRSKPLTCLEHVRRRKTPRRRREVKRKARGGIERSSLSAGALSEYMCEALWEPARLFSAVAHMMRSTRAADVQPALTGDVGVGEGGVGGGEADRAHPLGKRLGRACWEGARRGRFGRGKRARGISRTQP